MKAWTDITFDGKRHAIAAVDNFRFVVYFECGLVKQFTDRIQIPYKPWIPLISPDLGLSKKEAIALFDEHCKKCMGDRRWQLPEEIKT